ncbi:MAG: SURF1 family protein [Pseudomonadota bacterium]
MAIKNFIALFVILMSFIFLCSLGMWQVKRLAWKTEVITKIDEQYKNARDLSTEEIFSIQPEDFLYGTIQGQTRSQDPIFLGPIPSNNKFGYHVILPFEFDNQFILANMGWVNETEKESLELSYSGELIGLIRYPEWNIFTSENNPETGFWTKPSVYQISQYFELEDVAPAMIYVTNKTNELITEHPADWYPNNRHLQYAIFWFTMAFSLLAFSGYYIHKTKRSS